MLPAACLRNSLLIAAAGLALLGRPPQLAAANTPPPERRPAAATTVDAPPGCTVTTTHYQDVTPVAIPDLNTITRTLTVSGLSYDLWKVTAYTAISHTWNADLDIYLNSPYPADLTGTLTTQNGGSADNVFSATTWDDDQTLGVTEVAFTNNVPQYYLVPEGAMGNYRFHSPNGNWQLVVRDNAGGDTGTLNRWELEITTLNELLIVDDRSYSNSVDTPIANPGTTTSNIVVSNAGHYLTNVTAQTVISHSASGDLTLMLTAPDGLTTTLTNNRGGPFDNLYNGTTWTDSPIPPGGPVTDADYSNNVVLAQVQPEGAMGRFVGVDPNGTWTLTIKDNNSPNSGVLKDWSLGIYTGYCAPVYLPVAVR
ncbi:MAG: proprotein convertase P-domain-containing protein [Anaerolineales bacterium]|nr:proprotein convertase P-domain-containing protein [Anaerolineales bacterium]